MISKFALLIQSKVSLLYPFACKTWHPKSKVSLLPLSSTLSLNSFGLTSRFATHSSFTDFSIFFTGYLPPIFDKVIITGKEAVDSFSLRDILERELAHRISMKVKIRLVFGVIDVSSLPDNLIGSGSGSPESRLDSLLAISERIHFNEVGIEFIYPSKVVYTLTHIIKAAISYRDKKPEHVHIYIAFWDLSDL